MSQLLLQQQPQEKFFCNNHPSVEAVAFCATCSTMQDCSGCWCRECDEKVHEMFPAHQRTEHKFTEKKLCRKHPRHNAEGLFCWETKTFHCPLCAQKSNINGVKVSDAVDNVIQSMGNDLRNLDTSLKNLLVRRDKILFELSDDTNPNNLEQQMSQAMATTRAAFDQMRKIIEQRESDLLREIEKEFGAKTELLDNEVKSIADAIEKGENITKEYAMASSAKKDAKLLRRLFEMEAETKKLMGTAEKIEKSPLAQTTTKVILEGCEEIAESLKGLGRVVGTANIPAPSNFRAADSRCGYIALAWDKSEGCTTYQVTAKKTADPDSAWTEIYNGPDTRASCFNTEVCTSYMFKVTPMYNGTKSANSSTCTGQTDQSNFFTPNQPPVQPGLFAPQAQPRKRQQRPQNDPPPSFRFFF